MVRVARQSRPQLVCVLADNSGSMAGEKAQAATQGIREMLMECQSRGPEGPDRSYFKLLLIRFDHEAVVDLLCSMTPVRKIDPDRVSIDGRGGQTDITAALELTLLRLKPYMQALQQHPERAEHPLPLVLLFSDGEHNVGSGPRPVAEEIKRLNLDGEPVVIAVAGVSVGNEHPDVARSARLPRRNATSTLPTPRRWRRSSRRSAVRELREPRTWPKSSS